MRTDPIALLCAALLAALGLQVDAQPSTCTPIEIHPPNASDQQPAFDGQTRACLAPSTVAFDVVVVATGLAYPWAVEPLPGGDLLVSEKPGRLRIVSASGRIGDPIAGVLPVDYRGQGGLLDVALSPAFASDRTIFWSFTEPREGGNGTSVARAVLSVDRRRLEDVKVIFRVLPTYGGTLHFGSRLAFGRDGMLYVTTGERSDASMRPYAQRLDSHLGKIVRIARTDRCRPTTRTPAGPMRAARSGPPGIETCRRSPSTSRGAYGPSSMAHGAATS